MECSYFYCEKCGYEDEYIHVGYVRTVSNGDVLECPECKSESMDFVKDGAINL